LISRERWCRQQLRDLREHVPTCEGHGEHDAPQSGPSRDGLNKLSVFVDLGAAQFINSCIVTESAHDRLGHILDEYRLEPGPARTEQREYRQAFE
jgi:hypothetical protein